ncbi:MAG TPA: hypothetical protein VFE47_32100 [Tepidisphaeraceae bacterium]|jgi:6-phosphogluconolactonase (cycloisomerase 2 family)|nr:hypothetical protein [Tepidisphaeraceae bacterium]
MVQQILIAATVLLLTGVTLTADPGATNKQVAVSDSDAKPHVVQIIRNGDGGTPLDSYIQSVTSLGDYLYVSLRHNGKLLYFRRDAANGTLKYLGVLDGAKSWQKQIYSFANCGGRLYGICGTASHGLHDGETRGLHWFDIDPKTGAPTEKGKIEVPLSCEWGGMLASPNEKYLYVLLRIEHKVIRFKIDQDGTPVKVDETAITDFKPADGGCAGLTLTADGKFMYALCQSFSKGVPLDGKEVLHRDLSLACMKVKDDGSLVYDRSYSLKELTEGTSHWPQGKWGYGVGNAYGIAPDGLDCYANSYDAYGDNCRLVLYSRDPKTGGIAFKEDLTASLGRDVGFVRPMGANSAFVFEPDGKTGYCQGSGGFHYFTRDPKTGRLTYGGALAQSQTWSSFLYPVDGFLYMTTWDNQSIYVVKTRQGAAHRQ